MKTALSALALGVSALFASTAPATAQDPFIGQIILVPYSFCPRGFQETQGQLLPIAQNTALFSLLGTTYGGDGRTTFALPNLSPPNNAQQGQRGRSARGGGASVQSAQSNLRYCIAMTGTFPSRS
jgi:microcystin-dependent protein